MICNGGHLSKKRNCRTRLTMSGWSSLDLHWNWFQWFALFIFWGDACILTFKVMSSFNVYVNGCVFFSLSKETKLFIYPVIPVLLILHSYHIQVVIGALIVDIYSKLKANSEVRIFFLSFNITTFLLSI